MRAGKQVFAAALGTLLATATLHAVANNLAIGEQRRRVLRRALGPPHV